MSIIPQVDLPTATSIAVFFQFFGGAIFLGVGNNIFVSKLVSSLHKYTPSLDAQAVVKAGAASFRMSVGPEMLHEGLLAYNDAIATSFYLCAAGAAMAFVVSFGMEWKSVVQEKTTTVVQEKTVADDVPEGDRKTSEAAA